MRPRTWVVIGLVLMLFSVGAAAVFDDADRSPEEKYRYDIAVDDVPHRSAPGQSVPLENVQPEIREEILHQIESDPLFGGDRAERFYLDSLAEIAQYDYVEYRGLYYRLEIEGHGLVEVTSMEDMFNPYSVLGVLGFITILMGGLEWLSRRDFESEGSPKRASGEAE